jgi:outer membrane receptor protein involved in Fe transport
MKQILLIIGLLLLQAPIFAQSVSGTITDKQKRPIEGVQIFNQQNGKHAHTNDQGRFTLEAARIGDTLSISHLGFSSKKIVVSSLSLPLDIMLEVKVISLDEVVIAPEVNALNLITHINIETNPVNSSQDVLRQVPGLFIGQHAGGGKAEQIFLRGFDIDHGTDIAITADGLPVNMVSHAHGQGYADLHFLIPETIENIDFGKGPYYADKGNFNTSAYVNFNTKDHLDENLIKLEAGQFNSSRVMGMFNLANSGTTQAYLATEYLSTDGAFDSPQNFDRINIFGKYQSHISTTDQIGLLVSHFSSSWDASGQIPQRAVDQGIISRFGAIDDTEGGKTSRTNVLLNHRRFINKDAFMKNSVYFVKYDFELYSNFTFFLEDPIHGDQIRQKENRSIYGLSSEYNQLFVNDRFDGSWQAGISLRNDQVLNDELSHTADRQQTLDQLALGDVDETNMAGYFNLTVDWGKWTINPALRLDYFNFQYRDALLPRYQTQAATQAILSPKLNVLYHVSREMQLYLKAGKGFHSNDTRVVVARDGKEILPAAYGFDAGLLWKPVPRLVINTAYWNLWMDQEFVYVGDAGIVEPSGKTSRQGVDLSVRYQPIQWLFWNFDANYTYARAPEEKAGEDYIPLAPDLTLVTGLNMIHPNGFYGGINMRLMGDRPANEDNSIVAKGYTVIDLNLGYQWHKIDVGLQVQNLFNAEWNETQFATETRLQNEAFPVEEIHFIPGTPFFAKAVVSYKF